MYKKQHLSGKHSRQVLNFIDYKVFILTALFFSF